MSGDHDGGGGPSGRPLVGSAGASGDQSGVASPGDSCLAGGLADRSAADSEDEVTNGFPWKKA